MSRRLFVVRPEVLTDGILQKLQTGEKDDVYACMLVVFNGFYCRSVTNSLAKLLNQHGCLHVLLEFLSGRDCL